ncbi:MAG TPA: DegT/DnrJ/EryC1/StrS family aminotransferase [Candidatus Binataceae bacterium]|nr:DegT/DnrJ/EryC1/StrS family aminotransferase [Candidatus Binataceae bacterium]
MIKLVDLAAQNAEIMSQTEPALAELHRQTAYVGGPSVAAFENALAAYLGVKRTIGVGSGTDALRLALLAAGVGPGSEVLTVPLTFIATAEAIVQTGARPVLIDVDPIRRTMDPQAVRAYLQAGRWQTAQGPRALLPVHLYGLPAAMDELRRIGAQWHLPIIEDACQAHGARVLVGGRMLRAGAGGDFGCFSFYPGKNLGGWGEGGAIALNDEEKADQLARLRDHGRLSHYAHQEYGYNARLDSLQAVVLNAKLQRLEAWNARRRLIASWYSELLADSVVGLPAEPADCEPCYHLFVIESRRRDAIRQALLSAQIQCGIHYPVPLHLQPACRELGYRRGDFPISERLSDTVLSLPMHPHLSAREVQQVASVVRAAAGAGTSNV